MNGDGGRTGAVTRTKVEANGGTPQGNGDGSGNRAETGTGTGVETCRGTQNENRDGNEDGIREGGGEANERKKKHKTCRRDQSFSFRTRHDLCRPRVALAGTRRLCSQGLVSIHAHRTEGVAWYEVGDEANGFRGGIRVGDRNRDRNRFGGGNGDVNVDGEGGGAGTTTGMEANQGPQDGNENGRRGTGSRRVEERRVCASKPRRVVNAM